MQVLAHPTWRARADAHAARIDARLEHHLARRQSGEKHPIHDFLFTYYSQRPARLRRWHPGFGVRLENASDYAQLKGYENGAITQEYIASQRPLIEQLHTLLSATAGRPGQLGCFGLHEWAMVHGSERTETRHDWPLRLGAAGTDEVVESHRIACSHFDAFRFFTDTARPLNTLQPGRDDRSAFEQPACLHGNMDLYKHAFRLSPMIPSDLVADCFELACDIRVMDMRAAPYDFTGVVLDHTGEPWSPIPIETSEGKQAYATAQRAFAERAESLRQELIERCEHLLAATG